MNKAHVIQAWSALSTHLLQELSNHDAAESALTNLLRRTEAENAWFTAEAQRLTLQHFATAFFSETALQQWLAAYPEPVATPKTVALIPAGNIPFVGMHDLLCILCSGHQACVKLSSKDRHFIPWLKETLTALDTPYGALLAERIRVVDQISKPDAVIATGSNNTGRYFEYYFGKYPHIFRKNRSSVAILYGNEDPATLQQLGLDVFTYFGLGCRNVSLLFVPAGYPVESLLETWQSYKPLEHHHKYRNNLDYNLTLLLLNQKPYVADTYLILSENEALHAPLATLHYTRYQNEQELAERLQQLEPELQCTVSVNPAHIQPGQTQFPTLNDYADHIDTMQFLHQL